MHIEFLLVYFNGIYKKDNTLLMSFVSNSYGLIISFFSSIILIIMTLNDFKTSYLKCFISLPFVSIVFCVIKGLAAQKKRIRDPVA